MKASEVVSKLQELILKRGDLDVYSCDPNDDYSWLVHTVRDGMLYLDDDETYDEDTPEQTPCIIIQPT